MKKLIVVFSLLIAVTGNALAAAQVANAKVTHIRIDESGLGYAVFDAQTGSAACVHSSFASALSFDTNTPGGASVLMVLTTAKALNQLVTARGTGSCDDYGTVESWSWGWVAN